MIKVLYYKLSSACHEIVVFRPSEHSPVTFPHRSAKIQILNRGISDVDARGCEPTGHGAPVGSCAGHRGEFVGGLPSVLGISAGGCLFLFHNARLVKRLGLSQFLVEVVVIVRHACRQVVGRREVSLKHQLCIGIAFVHIVELESVRGVELVERAGSHHREVGIVVAVNDESMFHVGFITLSAECNLIERIAGGAAGCIPVMAVGYLPGIALFINGAESAVKYIRI